MNWEQLKPNDGWFYLKDKGRYVGEVAQMGSDMFLAIYDHRLISTFKTLRGAKNKVEKHHKHWIEVGFPALQKYQHEQMEKQA